MASEHHFNDYGVPTNADRDFKTKFVFSDEDDDTKTAMSNMWKLDCGHFHMGVYRKCSSCRMTMCGKCWLVCDEPVIDHLLSVDVAYEIGTGWCNTCTHCKEVNPDNSHCPEDCPGRQKFRCTSLYSGRTGHSTGGRGGWGGPRVAQFTKFFLRNRPWRVPRAGVVLWDMGFLWGEGGSWLPVLSCSPGIQRLVLD